MKMKLMALVLGAFLTIPCALRAEEVEIQLMEVIQMEPLPGDNPTRPIFFVKYLHISEKYCNFAGESGNNFKRYRNCPPEWLHIEDTKIGG